jgi:Ca2+-binding EF-hand superfamily protein
MSELSQALKDFGIYDDDAEELMKSADSNGDGQIDYQEFSFLLRSKNQGFEKSKGVKKNMSRY